MSNLSSPVAPPAPHRNGARAAASGERPGRTETDRSLLLDAVRDAATRATVAAGLVGLAVIHAVDAVGKWSETRYMFWMFVLAGVGAIVVAGWTIFTRSRLALLAAAGIAGSVLLGFIVNRTVGMPNAMDDIGNWTEPLGLASMVVEALTATIALAAYAVARRRPAS